MVMSPPAPVSGSPPTSWNDTSNWCPVARRDCTTAGYGFFTIGGCAASLKISWSVSSSLASTTYCIKIAACVMLGGTYRLWRIHLTPASQCRHMPGSTTSYTRCHTLSSSLAPGMGVRGSTRGIPASLVKPPVSTFSSLCPKRDHPPFPSSWWSSSSPVGLSCFFLRNMPFFLFSSSIFAFCFSRLLALRLFSAAIAAGSTTAARAASNSPVLMRFRPKAPACNSASRGRIM